MLAAGALFGPFIVRLLVPALPVLIWRQPVQAWLIRTGLAGLKPYYPMLHFAFPDFLLGLIAGGVIGILCFRTWASSVAWFTAGYVLFPWVPHYGFAVPAWLDYQCFFLGWKAAAVALPALTAACLVGRPERRREARRRAGACLICGYDLTGNVSGICPECGHVIAEPQAAR